MEVKNIATLVVSLDNKCRQKVWLAFFFISNCGFFQRKSKIDQFQPIYIQIRENKKFGPVVFPLRFFCLLTFFHTKCLFGHNESYFPIGIYNLSEFNSLVKFLEITLSCSVVIRGVVIHRIYGGIVTKGRVGK